MTHHSLVSGSLLSPVTSMCNVYVRAVQCTLQTGDDALTYRVLLESCDLRSFSDQLVRVCSVARDIDLSASLLSVVNGRL